jgi:hypothetical protein
MTEAFVSREFGDWNLLIGIYLALGAWNLVLVLGLGFGAWDLWFTNPLSSGQGRKGQKGQGAKVPS